MKIVIGGALGYIGSALIDALSTEDLEFQEITLIDRLFVPNLLANLPKKFDFINENVANVDRLKPVLDDADVVIVLAAETEAERSQDRETLVWETNFEACVKFIDACNPRTRVVFASTGNLFGGVSPDDKWQNLTEEDQPQPKLPYASSKFAVEKHLANSNKNYTICRFGTNFGFAPGVRFNLVTNIFVQRALEGKDLILYGRGENYRPNVHVQDAAGGILFLATHPEAEREIFHIVRHNMTIRELADTVVGVVGKGKIVLDDRPVPFNSYHLSNEKLTGLGFRFNWDLNAGVVDMVERFSSVKRRDDR